MSDWARTFADDLKMVWENDYLTYKALVGYANASDNQYEFASKCRDLYNEYVDQIDVALESVLIPDAARQMVYQALYNPGSTPFDLLAADLYDYYRNGHE